MVVLCYAMVSSGWAQSTQERAASEQTTAWRDGVFHVDVPGVVGRSDIVLARPNIAAGEALPLGNGRLGVAVWSADGLTAQLNRADTLPRRLSPGQVVVPGLAALTSAKDYVGRLDLYNGEIREQGGGMTATVYVQPKTDTLVIDVTGAKPEEQQTAKLKLWSPRAPRAAAKGQVGVLSEAWTDDKEPDSSGRMFGSLSAITAQGRGVTVNVADPLTLCVSFKPYADGHYRLLVASPHFDGKGGANVIAHKDLRGTAAAHHAWWHEYWNRAGLMRIASADGAGEYMENLRMIYLFAARVEKGEEYPGSQAGVADMISSARDVHRWAP